MYVIAVSLDFDQLSRVESGRFALPTTRLVALDQALNTEKSVLESLVLATCNRTEVYAVVDQLHTGRYYIRRFLAREFKLTIADLDRYVQVYQEDAAVAHLFSVVCGLEAQVLGEPQVLGQFRTAWLTAQAAGTTGALLNQLGKQAIAFGKQMHSRFKIAEFAQSAGQAGLHQLKLRLAPLADKTILVIGAGQFAQHVIQNATGMGFARILLTNRHALRAETLANRYPNVTTIPWAQRASVATQVAAVVLATSAATPVLTLKATGTLRVVIDLGVPRNLGAMPDGVCDIDIEQLVAIVDDNHQQRLALKQAIQAQIPVAVSAFRQWEQELHVVPVIRELRQSALAVEAQVFTSLMHKLPELDEHQQKIVAKHLKSIVNQLLKTPIQTIKEASVAPDADVDLNQFRQLFGLSQPEEEEHVSRG